MPRKKTTPQKGFWTTFAKAKYPVCRKKRKDRLITIG